MERERYLAVGALVSDEHGNDSAPRAPRDGGSAAIRAVRGFARHLALVVTALAIVLALAFGIPWLVDLIW